MQYPPLWGDSEVGDGNDRIQGINSNRMPQCDPCMDGNYRQELVGNSIWSCTAQLPVTPNPDGNGPFETDQIVSQLIMRQYYMDDEFEVTDQTGGVSQATPSEGEGVDTILDDNSGIISTPYIFDSSQWEYSLGEAISGGRCQCRGCQLRMFYGTEQANRGTTSVDNDPLLSSNMGYPLSLLSDAVDQYNQGSMNDVACQGGGSFSTVDNDPRSSYTADPPSPNSGTIVLECQEPMSYLGHGGRNSVSYDNWQRSRSTVRPTLVRINSLQLPDPRYGMNGRNIPETPQPTTNGVNTLRIRLPIIVSVTSDHVTKLRSIPSTSAFVKLILLDIRRGCMREGKRLKDIYYCSELCSLVSRQLNSWVPGFPKDFFQGNDLQWIVERYCLMGAKGIHLTKEMKEHILYLKKKKENGSEGIEMSAIGRSLVPPIHGSALSKACEGCDAKCHDDLGFSIQPIEFVDLLEEHLDENQFVFDRDDVVKEFEKDFKVWCMKISGSSLEEVTSEYVKFESVVKEKKKKKSMKRRNKDRSYDEDENDHVSKKRRSDDDDDEHCDDRSVYV